MESRESPVNSKMERGADSCLTGPTMAVDCPRMSRSRIHMLMVLAAIADDHHDADEAKRLRKAAEREATRHAEGRADGTEEIKRIERQRTAFAMVMPTASVTAFKQALLQRAYDLMYEGQVLACDALVEFLPADDVDRMFECWRNDTENDGPKSGYYEGKGRP